MARTRLFFTAMALATLTCGPEVSADPSPTPLPVPSTKGAQASISAVAGFPSVYQSKVNKSCPASTQCVAFFAFVPTNRVLQATNINCLGLASNNAQATFVLVTSLTDPMNYFVAKSDNQFRFSINELILSFFEAGTRPKMVLAADVNTGLQLVCNLTGTLLTP